MKNKYIVGWREDFIGALLLAIPCLILGVALVLALISTSNHIGFYSSFTLMTCHPTFTDEQCIGKEKAKIISDLQNDGGKTHGVQIFYDNSKKEYNFSSHEHKDLINHQLRVKEEKDEK